MEQFKEELGTLLNRVPRYEGAYLAGGAITASLTGAAVHDYDIYFKDRHSFLKAVESAYEDGMFCVCLSPRAITFSDHGTIYQFMLFEWFEAPAAIFGRFDYTCCMAAIDLETGEFTTHPDFLRDLTARRLRFNHKTSFPIASLMRIEKYEPRGYSIEPAERLKVAIACAFTRLENWDQLRDQIGGAYGARVAVDTEKTFSLANVMEAVTNAVEHQVEKPEGLEGVLKTVHQETPGGFESAVEYIYGENQMEDILKEYEERMKKEEKNLVAS